MQIQTEQAAKNSGFTQVYSKGWKRIRELSIKNSGATGLYAFFAENIDPACGAVVCDQQFLADQMQVSRMTISRWLKFLEDEHAVLRIPIAGRVCAYALDPYEVWKGYDTAKSYASFITKTLVNKDGEIKRRLQSMFSKQDKNNQSDLEDFAG
ncbi:helix-turn-helix domain-containing protein [Commensalibacter papalotli (ex Botero et al. 2024)]|uniref:Helix-turn-helix domain-containing protein n=1 Tax=Commensalibacter papalotli (ex Botero et al. 2024) TaxID=2972766 RepID=A0ABM9HV17_9PROT|nr:helix-turn-helix domain-containing protein [Commensalibacter papalotli (ex Botero et al. 2024)]CAI3957764.1 unnamed protein product [Commensalibacter papalotli (ex Botero et al. 2024)]